ncbi:beta-1,3-galactosyltransferase 4 [Hemicordylus capensis]|uniref:beta-1,3-galactosyltransferase 4 n=1 Tax=Hemicordylus capensis TaxID=884348 RepID=UPI002304851A|nr:beta-1,3-galactosyltransferase 4 [Hemicordylus capensis]XP_053152910.1 beta-1,3-galactosyltransferase 4 [Hemicordylus capensis]XP_053152911.1 beta-1,3-galactosyltransferase 4 [Hemicordylus capensis]XP_053152912.1 beta-1,3-galactosyltransferase 4 [Hemicordylus capensis]XP_053152913.1 beta-1,3-galactosyltransferase 4 [Hemicordylus capensis]XP_053152914.1 beta-1,3-galactosyltransferase 4 [Hemicordylus capensis]XP_053152915.1 beta-1,3-galactosyltransferase 4 [Hemicordylus capensis]XP_05315291
MDLPPCHKRCPRRRLLWWLLSGLAVLSVASFLVTGGHEELLSHSLPFFLASRERSANDPILPSSDAFLLLPPPDTCTPRPPFLLVLVTSAPSHTLQRQAVRETWGGVRWAAGYPVQTFFALGLPREPSQQAALQREAEQHGDIVQGRFTDTYANLTLKTLALMGWATTYCTGATFIIKADDDVFLNLPALAQHLGTLTNARGTYLGRIHWRVRPNRDPHSRHYVPASLYLPTIFPPYCSGTAYILSGDTAAALLGVAHHVPLVPVEDAFVGLCAHQAGITPQHEAHMAGSAHFPPDPCCYREVLYSVHGVIPSKMLDMWHSTGLCGTWQRTLGLLRCKTLAWLAAL